jgi:hypothetical protein
MQTNIEVDDTDEAVNEMCAAAAKDILARSSSDDEPADRQMREAAFAAVTLETQRLAHIGKAGPWCYFCGVDEVTGWCSCAFPADLRCHQRFICELCRKAHVEVAQFIQKMCSFPVVERADSRRSQFEIRLYRAASRVCNPTDSDEYDHAAHRDLAFHLAQADPFGDGETFRAGVLRAFRVSKFMDYQALAAELEKQEHQAIIREIRRALRAQKTPPRTESESFYR